MGTGTDGLCQEQELQSVLSINSEQQWPTGVSEERFKDCNICTSVVICCNSLLSHGFAPPQEMDTIYYNILYISRFGHSIQLQWIPWTVWNKDIHSDPFWSKNYGNLREHLLHPTSMTKCLARRLGFPQSLIHTVAATQDKRLVTGQWWHCFSKRAKNIVEV